MANNSNHKRPPPLEWRNFFIGALVVVVVIGLLTLVPSSSTGGDVTDVGMIVFGISLLAFSAYRFHRLRRDIANGHISAEQFWVDPQKHMRGPMIQLIAWAIATVLLVTAVAYYSVGTPWSLT